MLILISGGAAISSGDLFTSGTQWDPRHRIQIRLKPHKEPGRCSNELGGQLELSEVLNTDSEGLFAIEVLVLHEWLFMFLSFSGC